MFEKLKVKAKSVKNWIMEHKGEIIVGTLSACVGAIGTTLILDKTKSETNNFLDDYTSKYGSNKNLLVDVCKVEAMSGGRAWICGEDIQIKDLSANLIEKRTKEDAIISGALIYTKGDII